MDTAIMSYGGLRQRLRRDFQLFKLSLALKSPLEAARCAFSQTAWYRHHYQGFPEDFAQIPIVCREDFDQADPYDLLADDAKETVTGYFEPNVGGLFLTPGELDLGIPFAYITPFIGLIQQTLEENRVVVSGLGLRRLIADEVFFRIVRALGGMFAGGCDPSAPDRAQRMARMIGRLCPSILIGTTSDVLHWLKVLRDTHPDSFGRVIEYLKIIITTGDPCSPLRSRALQKAFGVDHINIYARSEGFWTLPCPCGEHHVLPPYLVEVMQDDGSVASGPGQGRLIITHLTRRSTPLVRFDIGDMGEISASSCPYGFRNSVLWHGPVAASIILEGRRVGVRDFEEVIYRHGLAGEFRVEIRDKSVSITVEEYGYPIDADLLGLDVADCFGCPGQVKIVPFGTITNAAADNRPIVRIHSPPGRDVAPAGGESAHE